MIASVLGQNLDSAEDVDRIGDLVRAESADVLQANHTLSGIDIAMWDLLGRRYEEPVYKLLGYARAEPRQPYASVLFGDTAQDTLEKARGIREKGYLAAKFGWGPYGKGSVDDDREQVEAAAGRESELQTQLAAAARREATLAAERDALDTILDHELRATRATRARTAIGAFRSGTTNTSTEHDEAPLEAFA